MFSSRFKWDLRENRLARLLAEKRGAGARVLDLTESNPTRAGFAYPVGEILGALARPEALAYEPAPRGLVGARQAVTDYYAARGTTVDPDHVHLTASTSEGYSYLFKLLTDPGQQVLVPQPSYPLFEFLAALEGVEPRPYELRYAHPSGWSLDFDSLERAATPGTRAVVVVSPHNPTGSFLKREESVRLAGFCAERGLALVADEVFGDYAFAPDPARAGSLAGESAALSFVLSGFSKILALPQMKLGWVVTGGPEPLRHRALERLDLIADTFLSAGAPAQHAAAAWLGLRDGLQRQILGRARANLEWLVRLAADSPCRLLTVEGGWSAILEMPRYVSEEEWALALLAHDDVLAHPGYFFDFPREAFLVVSLLAREEIFREATARLLARVEAGPPSGPA